MGAGLLILALAAGGAGFGLVRWKAGSKKRELAEQGVMAMNVGDYETAITVFDQALEAPENELAILKRTYCLTGQRQNISRGILQQLLLLIRLY